MIYRIIYEIDLANALSLLIRPIVRETQDARGIASLPLDTANRCANFSERTFLYFPSLQS